MNLKVERVIPNLRAHTIINNSLVASCGYRIYKSKDFGETWQYCGQLPVPNFKRLLSKNRLAARALRMGISQIEQISKDRTLICCDKEIFLSDLSLSYFKRVNIPIRSFQSLDNSICVTPKYIYYGEYFRNPKRTNVNVFRSEDGWHWEVVYSFPEKAIRHIHLLQYDHFSDKIWFSTGDADTECLLGFTDLDFSDFFIIGRGSQRWRALELLFTEDKVYWGMDTPEVQSQLLMYDRKRGDVETIADFDGPVFNLRKVGEKGYIIATDTEQGDGEWDNKAHIWFSTNLHNWEDSVSYEKDALPVKMGGLGRLILAHNMTKKIVCSGQALKEVDNKLLILSLDS